MSEIKLNKVYFKEIFIDRGNINLGIINNVFIIDDKEFYKVFCKDNSYLGLFSKSTTSLRVLIEDESERVGVLNAR